MYAKLFTSIYQGTLRGNSHGLLVFTNLLAHCDKEGVVDMHPKGIAEEVGLSIEQVKVALIELESVDEESRSHEENGRRIIRVDEHRAWGWRVVNYAKYRAIRDEDDRREQNRLSQARWREKNKPQSASVITGNPRKPPSAHTEAEADTKKKEHTARGSRLPADWVPDEAGEKFAAGFGLARSEVDRFRDYWHSQPGKSGVKLSWQAIWRNWCRNAKPMARASPYAKPEATLTVPSSADKETARLLAEANRHKAEVEQQRIERLKARQAA